MSLLVVGSVALDCVETPFGKREEALGGAATFFSTSASYFAPVSVVGVIGEDFPEEHLDFLRSRKINLEGLSRVPGKTFRWKGSYGLQLNEAKTLDTQLNVFQRFSPKLPESYRDIPHVFLANIDPKLQLQVLDQVRSPKLVAADTMNFWIEGSRPDLLKTLQRVQLLFVNDGEARLLAGEHNLVKAARAIRKMGPGRVVIKRGEHGALLFDGAGESGGIFSCPALPLEEVFDPTGAGDTFAGGFMGYVAGKTLTPEVLRTAMVVGSTMASFAVEQFSVDRLRTLTRADIAHRYTQFQQLTHFQSLELGEPGTR